MRAAAIAHRPLLLVLEPRLGFGAAVSPLAAVDADQTLDEVFSTLTGRTNAVVVAESGKPVGVLTRSDLLEFLAHHRGDAVRP